ncbi:hypothetical protein [Xanthomonas phage SB3]|uniref:Uncharacterized protein n=1 Tax=Xanthomonas phage SB3 TaxID=3117472 RepID=A0ABZ2GUJ5_9CAUD
MIQWFLNLFRKRKRNLLASHNYRFDGPVTQVGCTAGGDVVGGMKVIRNYPVQAATAELMSVEVTGKDVELSLDRSGLFAQPKQTKSKRAKKQSREARRRAKAARRG